MLIKDLKDKYPLVYEAAMKNCNEGCNENYNISSSFTWDDTPEGEDFWNNINAGQFDRAKERCPHLFIESPKKSETMFRKGDYIVILNKPNGILDYLPPNYVYKQNRNYDCVYSDVDIRGTKTSCTDVEFVNKNDWRYATSEEIAEYNRLGKPFDVTTMNMKTKPLYMKAIQEEAKRRFPIGCKFRNTDGEEYLLEDDYMVYKINDNIIYASCCCGCLYENGKWATLISMPGTKQTYTVDELVVGETYVESSPRWNYHYILQIGETEHSRLEIDNDSDNVKHFAYSEWKSASRDCSYRKATTDEIRLLNEYIFKQIKTSILGDVGYVDASTKYRMGVDKADHIIEVKRPTPQPLLLNKTKPNKQLVNLK